MTLKIDGGILAGGLARRMGGQNKGLALYRCQPMIQSIAFAMRPYVQQLLINCNRDSDAIAQYCDKTVTDAIAGFHGPLAGIHALLCASNADYVLISSCDTPLLNEHYAQTMLKALAQDNNETSKTPAAYYAICNGVSQPTHLLISTALSSALGKRVQQNKLRALEWLQDIEAVAVPFDDATLFYNVNSTAELSMSPSCSH